MKQDKNLLVASEVAQTAYREMIRKAREWCDLYSASTLYASDLMEYLETLSPESLKEDKEVEALIFNEQHTEVEVVYKSKPVEEAVADGWDRNLDGLVIWHPEPNFCDWYVWRGETKEKAMEWVEKQLKASRSSEYYNGRNLEQIRPVRLVFTDKGIEK